MLEHETIHLNKFEELLIQYSGSHTSIFSKVYRNVKKNRLLLSWAAVSFFLNIYLWDGIVVVVIVLLSPLIQSGSCSISSV